MRRLIWTFAALLLLTGLAFGVSYLPLGPWGSPVAMSIALGKSVLIALFFMHLVEHGVSSRITITVAVALAMFLVGFALLDVGTRENGGDEGGVTVSGLSLDAPASRGPEAQPWLGGAVRTRSGDGSSTRADA